MDYPGQPGCRHIPDNPFAKSNEFIFENGFTTSSDLFQILSIFVAHEYQAASGVCQPKSANSNVIDQLINIEGQARLLGHFLEKEQLLDFFSILILKPGIFDDDTGLVCEESEQIDFLRGKVQGAVGSIS